MKTSLPLTATALAAALALGFGVATAQTMNHHGGPDASGAAANSTQNEPAPAHHSSGAAGNASGSGGENGGMSDHHGQAATRGEFITRQKSSQLLGSSIIGSEVRNGPASDAKEIGKVTDLILDKKDDKLVGVVVGVGGFLGIGQKDVGIPWSAIKSVDPKTETIQVQVTKADLENAPEFTSKKKRQSQEKEHEHKQRSAPANGASAPTSGPGSAPATTPGSAPATTPSPAQGK